MGKIPTAEEFLYAKLMLSNQPYLKGKQYKQALIDFAKLHVQEALEEAYQHSKLVVNNSEEYRELDEQEDLLDEYECGSDTVSIHKGSIINAYPLTNIK